MSQNLEISPNTYYTPDEVATMLRVSRRSVQRLLDSGFARSIKIGRSWRILGSDLLQLPRENEIADADLTVSLMRLSRPAFAEVWDNDEDSIYDHLLYAVRLSSSPFPTRINPTQSVVPPLSSAQMPTTYKCGKIKYGL